MSTIRRMSAFVAPYRVCVGVAFGFSAVACALNLLLPVLVERLVDQMVSGGAWRMKYLAALLAVYAGQAVISVVIADVINPVGLGVARDLRQQVYARLQRLELEFYDKTPAGAIISRLMDDVTILQSLISGQVLGILTDAGTAVGVLGLLLAYDRFVGMTAILVLAVYGIAFGFFGQRIRSGSAEVRAELDRIFGHLKERLDGVLVVRAYAREEAEVTEFSKRIEAAHEPRVRVGRLGATFSNLSTGLNGVGTTLVFGVAALETLRGGMTAGEAMATATLASLLFGPVTRVADLIQIFEQAGASVDRLGEILDMNVLAQQRVTPMPSGWTPGLVEFDGVSFEYNPGRPVLRDIRLRVEPGIKVAVVGPTGCGKSTLLSLLPRFYEPTSGEIRLDGVPLSWLELDLLRRRIAIVPQEATIFRTSLAANIAYGVANALPDRVEAAARAARVHELAERLPRGYATLVGEGGYPMSQGERQRVAIARAFCKDAPIIILDEATSSLDTGSEAEIQAALANLLKGRTAFVIAHRLATVIDADLIVVMDGGRIVQMGTHGELMADSRGLYFGIAGQQFLAPVSVMPWRPAVVGGVPSRALDAGPGALGARSA